MPLLGLDGVSRISGDQDDCCAKIKEYYTTIEAGLEEHSVEEVRDTSTVPEELRTLSEPVVDGLTEVGLSFHRSWHQAAFWTRSGGEAPKALARRVTRVLLLCASSLGYTQRIFWLLRADGKVVVEWRRLAVWCIVAEWTRREFAWRYTASLGFESDRLIFDKNS